MPQPETVHALPTWVTPNLKWWNTLSFRLALVLNLTVICVFGAFDWINYRNEHTELLQEEIERLREEAKILGVARDNLPAAADFQRFVDGFCRQMSLAASPGHHIVVFDASGNVIMRAHERNNPRLEIKMSNHRNHRSSDFLHDGVRYVSVAVGNDEKEIISVAQSLAPIERTVRAHRTGRLVSMGVLIVLIMGLTTIGLLIWVRNPLRKLVKGVSEIGQRRFDYRVQPTGSPELRFLAEGINEMAQSLDRVEQLRLAEMERAREIQQGLLPDNHLLTEQFKLAAVFLPTDSVGGDLYDIIELEDGSILLAVLDVVGHGIPAALHTALLRTILRHQAAADGNVSQIAKAMNEELSGIGGAGEFATCFLARLRGDTGQLEYVSAGHDPAVVVRSDGAIDLLTGGSPLLGIEAGLEYKCHQATLNPLDRLFIYTDGLYEALSPQGELLGRERLVELLVKLSWVPIEVQPGLVVEHVQSFQGTDQFADDVTLLAVRRNLWGSQRPLH